MEWKVELKGCAVHYEKAKERINLQKGRRNVKCFNKQETMTERKEVRR